MGLCPFIPLGKTVRAASRVGEALNSFGPFEMAASDILPFSKSIMAAVFPLKSVLIKPSALLGSDHIKRVFKLAFFKYERKSVGP